jgi:hypothetical protein
VALLDMVLMAVKARIQVEVLAAVAAARVD